MATPLNFSFFQIFQKRLQIRAQTAASIGMNLEVHRVEETRHESNIALQKLPFLQERFTAGGVEGFASSGEKSDHRVLDEIKRRRNTESFIEKEYALYHLRREGGHSVERIAREDLETVVEIGEFSFDISMAASSPLDALRLFISR